MEKYKIYLDVCCLNRQTDDQSQTRIKLETEAILTIVSNCQFGSWRLITSDTLDEELNKTSNVEKLQRANIILSLAKIRVVTGSWLKPRLEQLQDLGFKYYDAAHIACAERAEATAFLTTDDRLLKRANRNAEAIEVNIDNPLAWLDLITVREKEENENSN